MNKKLEIRQSTLPGLEYRADSSGNGTVVGYASVYDQRYETDWMVEIIKPGAFKRALSEKQDVRALIDHDSTLVLGRTRSGTLTLKDDQRGLYTETALPDTTYAKDLREKMTRGDVDGMSFGFIATDQVWGERDGKFYREILDVDLFDISVVTYPAYTATSAQLRSEVRSLADTLEEGKRIVMEQREKHDGELSRFFTELDKYLATLDRL